MVQGYVEELRKQISKERCPERQEELAKLVSELCALNLAIAMSKPSEFAKFHVSKLDEETSGASQAPPETWKRCLVRSIPRFPDVSLLRKRVQILKPNILL